MARAQKKSSPTTTTTVAKRRGNPGKYDPKFIPVVEKLVARGLINVEIAEILGISEVTLYNWMLLHEDFAKAMERSKGVRVKQVEENLVMRANGFERKVEKATASGKKVVITEYYPPDVAAQRFYLQHNKPEVYRERTESVTKIDISDKFVKLLNSVEESAKIEQPAKRQLLIDRLNAIDVDPDEPIET